MGAFSACSDGSTSTEGVTKALICDAANARVIEGKSYCIVPESEECPDATPDRFLGASAVVCAPVSTRNVDLPLGLCEEAGAESCEQLSFRPSSEIDIVRNCEAPDQPFYPRCESDVKDIYQVHETGECLTPCPDGTCDDGKSCVKASLRVCDYGGCDACQQGIGVCVELFELSGASEVDGNGIVAWMSSPDFNRFRGELFEARGGAFSVALVSVPNAIGRDTPYGSFSIATLVVMDPAVYDLHRLPPDEISDENRAALEQAVADNNSASFAGSCEYRILYRYGAIELGLGDQDRESYAWLQDFPVGYSCARVRSPINGKDSYQLVDCSDVTLKQGQCLGTDSL